MSGGAVVAAAAAARRRRLQAVLDAFRIADATAPERARTLASIGTADSAELTYLIDSGVVAAGRSQGSWYLNEGAYVAHRDAKRVHIRRRMVILLGCVVFILGAIAGILARTA
jgi:hypothetical protein